MSDTAPRLSPNNNKVHALEKQPTIAWTSNPLKPSDLSVLAFIVTILFNHILGFIAYHFTVSAKHSWHLNDYKKSKQHSRYAKTFIILGILVGIATYAIAITLYITLKSDSSCSTTSTGGSLSQINGNLNTSSKTRITTPTTTSMETSTALGNVTTTCCQHCPLLNNPGGGAARAVLSPNTCDIYCTTSGNGPIYPDLTQKHGDCCVDLGCFLNF